MAKKTSNRTLLKYTMFAGVILFLILVATALSSNSEKEAQCIAKGGVPLEDRGVMQHCIKADSLL